ncbi:MAG: hypothetical protein ABI743_00495 [bacterium]
MNPVKPIECDAAPPDLRRRKRRRILVIGLVVAILAVTATAMITFRPRPESSLAHWSPGCPPLETRPWIRVMEPVPDFLTEVPPVKPAEIFHDTLWLETPDEMLLGSVWIEEEESVTYITGTTDDGDIREVVTPLDDLPYQSWPWVGISRVVGDELIVVGPKHIAPQQLSLQLLRIDLETLTTNAELALPTPPDASNFLSGASPTLAVIMPDGAWIIAATLRGPRGSRLTRGLYCWRVDPATGAVSAPRLLPPPLSHGSMNPLGIPEARDASLVGITAWFSGSVWGGEQWPTWELTEWDDHGGKPTVVERPSAMTWRMQRVWVDPAPKDQGLWHRGWMEHVSLNQQPVRLGAVVDFFATTPNYSSAISAFPAIAQAPSLQEAHMACIHGLQRFDNEMGSASSKWVGTMLDAEWLPGPSRELPADMVTPMQRFFFESRSAKDVGHSHEATFTGLNVFALDADTTLVTQMALDPALAGAGLPSTLLRIGRFEPPMQTIQWDGYVALPPELAGYLFDRTLQITVDDTGLWLCLSAWKTGTLLTDPHNSGWWYTHLDFPASWPPVAARGWISSMPHYPPWSPGTPCVAAPVE